MYHRAALREGKKQKRATRMVSTGQRLGSRAMWEVRKGAVHGLIICMGAAGKPLNLHEPVSTLENEVNSCALIGSLWGTEEIMHNKGFL